MSQLVKMGDFKSIRTREISSMIFFASLLCGTLSQAATPSEGPRKVISLNQSWHVKSGDHAEAIHANFDLSHWTHTDIPHSWHTPDSTDAKSIYYKGISWYRKQISGDAVSPGQSVFLEFDGVGEIAEVYLNGKRLGEHRSAYGRFRMDISGQLKKGVNTLAVRTDNRSHPDILGNGRGWTPFGGIYRDVSLIITSPIHIDTMDSASSGVYVTPSKVSAKSAVIKTISRIANDTVADQSVRVKTTLLDAAGVSVAETITTELLTAKKTRVIQVITQLEKPHLWHGVDDPYLYSARVEILAKDGKVLDLLEVPFGIRSYRFDPNKGFFLNGKPYPIKGVSLHQERKDTGWAITSSMFEEDLDILLEMGGNAVRSHYQMSDTFYKHCAQKGLLVWAEIPFWQYSKVSKPLMDNAKMNMREMVMQNYNNPAIIIWSVANECITKLPSIRKIISEMHHYVHSLDQTRVTTYANPESFGAIPQLVSELTDIASYNWYCGWYVDRSPPGGPATGLGALADSYHSHYPNQSIGISEYGASACLNHHEQNPSIPDPGGKWFPEEYQNYLHETYWKQVSQRPYLYGVFVWCMYDFNIEGWNRGNSPNMNWKGLVTQDRKTKKDAFYYYKANWSDTPFVYITSRRHIKRTEAQTSVKIYSNCPVVELTVNGKLLPRVIADHGVFNWNNVTLQPGRNIIQVAANKDKKTPTDKCIWIYDKKGTT